MCFNCFSKGHKKTTCKNQVRCINCAERQHISRYCPKKTTPINKEAQEINTTTNQEKKEQPIVNIKEKQKEKPQPINFKEKQQEKPQSTILQTQKPQNNHKQKNIDISNWETMEFIHPDRVEVERAKDMKVFINPRDELLPPKHAPVLKQRQCWQGPTKMTSFSHIAQPPGQPAIL